MFHKILIPQAVSFNFHFSESVTLVSLCLGEKKADTGVELRLLYVSCIFFSLEIR